MSSPVEGRSTVTRILADLAGSKTRVRSGIPPRIIQTSKNVELPLRARAMAANLKLQNPEFEYIFFDDQRVEEFIDHEFPQYRKAFDAFQFKIQKFDFFRYLAVYHYGGFYFDLDVILATGLAPLLEHSAVFPFEGLTLSRFLRDQYQMDWEIGNYAFGAAAGHPFLEAVIENCVKAQRDRTWANPMMQGLPWLLRNEFLILNTTGPGLISRTLAENPEIAKAVTVLFPDDVCDVANSNRFGEFGIHLMDGSWRVKSGWVYRRLAQRWEDRTRRRLLKQSVSLGKTRSLEGLKKACKEY